MTIARRHRRIDPTVNLRAVINNLEQGRIDTELLKIKVKLAIAPTDYAVNNSNKKIGMLLGAKAGDIIWYFRTDDKEKSAISINPKETGILKYRGNTHGYCLVPC